MALFFVKLDNNGFYKVHSSDDSMCHALISLEEMKMLILGEFSNITFSLPSSHATRSFSWSEAVNNWGFVYV